jgi:hypothetical protein
MKIIIDILHYAHMNFFKQAIFHFLKNGIDVELIVQPRGNLERIIQYEYGLPYTVLGYYEKSFIRKTLSCFYRDFLLYQYLRKSNFDIAASGQSINVAHATIPFRKPSIIFTDDVEFGLEVYPYKFLATHIVIPRFIKINGRNILRYKGFKELAYLHPNYFTPSTKVLSEYNLKQSQYVFMRDVSNSSLNYTHLEEGYLSKVCPYLKDMGFDIVLSLENPIHHEKYSKYCTILQEPVSDIHSLMHYASLTIASGDSMARESVLLRTPAIYTGKREMAVNSELVKKGCLFKRDNLNEIVTCVIQIIEGDLKKKTESIILNAITDEWVDTTKVIIDIISSKLYNDPELIQEYFA